MALPTVFEIEHSCGHVAERDLSDKPAGKRAGLAEWLGKSPCFDCFKAENASTVSAEVKAGREARRAEAIEWATTHELAVLRGTDKQKDWAFRVRHEMLAASYEALVVGDGMAESDYDKSVLEPARLVDFAGWWIDNRNVEVRDLPELLADAGLDERASSTENPL
ncbi:hypothetical protein ASF48_17720 [Rathayibacter sp. Leaf299]|uniref:hypothetical protein n=1 Tax=Rathayibacter sp. Leaf299 TaxID=1736328 RepID=UPI0006FC4AAD|nr:hypothetical protein [Rathayibacter sp. Leaf299]KQQ18756.1 hypothetical protein ASF48_17720 [Rathayibacter sp. Leaf299]